MFSESTPTRFKPASPAVVSWGQQQVFAVHSLRVGILQETHTKAGWFLEAVSLSQLNAAKSDSYIWVALQHPPKYPWQ
jgi:hypothetical protein